MKVLSLSQPWATLLFIPVPGRWPESMAKEWETRGWKPNKEYYEQIQREGLLIHASATWRPDQRMLLKQWPFSEYIQSSDDLPFGFIIGKVKVGRIISTDEWVREKGIYEDGAVERYAEEFKFGDYRPCRYAWEIKEAVKFEAPIKAKGKLSLWDFNL